MAKRKVRDSSANTNDDCITPKVEKKEMKVIQPEQIGAYLQAAADHNVLPVLYFETKIVQYVQLRLSLNGSVNGSLNRSKNLTR